MSARHELDVLPAWTRRHRRDPLDGRRRAIPHAIPVSTAVRRGPAASSWRWRCGASRVARAAGGPVRCALTFHGRASDAGRAPAARARRRRSLEERRLSISDGWRAVRVRRRVDRRTITQPRFEIEAGVRLALARIPRPMARDAEIRDGAGPRSAEAALRSRRRRSCRARPPWRRRAPSAQRSMSSSAGSSPFHGATPADAVCAARRAGAHAVEHLDGLAEHAAGQQRPRSSPPSRRATKSTSRTAAAQAAAASLSSRSPSRSPRSMLKAPRWSRSSTARQSGASARRARASSRGSSASNMRRVARPVSGSLSASSPTRARRPACSIATAAWAATSRSTALQRVRRRGDRLAPDEDDARRRRCPRARPARTAPSARRSPRRAAGRAPGGRARRRRSSSPATRTPWPRAATVARAPGW